MTRSARSSEKGKAGTAPGLLAPLANRAFRTFWVAGFADNLGRWVDTLVLGWLALELTDSVLLVALAGMLRQLPVFLLSALVGSAADRYGRRTMLALAMSANAAICAGLAVLFGLGWLSYPLLVVGAFGLGCGLAVEMTVRRALLADLSDRAALLPAVSLEMLTSNISRVLGPVTAGALLAALGGGVGYAACAAMYGVSALLLWRLRTALAAAPPGAAPAAPAIGMRAALRVLLGDEAIVGVLGMTIAMNVLVFPYQQILAVFARDILHTNAFGFGLLGAADALGATAGIVLLAQRPRTPQAWVFIGGSAAMSLMLMVFSQTTAFPLALAVLTLYGVVHSGFSTMQSGITLHAASPEVRGRAGGWLSMAIGTGPLGLLAMGSVASVLGPPLAVGGSAFCGLLTVAAIAGRYRRFRGYRW